MTSRDGDAVFVAVWAVVFVAAAFQISALCGWLSPLALAIVFWYSLAKRYTYYTQAFLGPGDGGGAGRRLAGRRRARRLDAVAARPGHRAVGGRLRHHLRLPGRRRSIGRRA